jgi:hypothetical protein
MTMREQSTHVDQSCLRWFAAVLISPFALWVALIIAVDPYGAFAFSPHWMRGEGRLYMSGGYMQEMRYIVPRLARDPTFDSAIIGNSSCQAISPETLNVELGGNWVNLCLGGAPTHEQAFALSAFLRHHAPPRAILWAIFPDTCSADPGPDFNAHVAFPIPLYVPSLVHFELLFNGEALRQAALQVLERLGRKAFLPAPALPESYYQNGEWNVFESLPYDLSTAARRARIYLPAANLNSLGASLNRPFPSHQNISGTVHLVPADTRKILVLMPFHGHVVPVAGSESDRRLSQCKDSLAKIAANVPNGYFVDFSAILRLPKTMRIGMTTCTCCGPGL